MPTRVFYAVALLIAPTTVTASTIAETVAYSNGLNAAIVPGPTGPLAEWDTYREAGPVSTGNPNYWQCVGDDYTLLGSGDWQRLTGFSFFGRVQNEEAGGTLFFKFLDANFSEMGTVPFLVPQTERGWGANQWDLAIADDAQFNIPAHGYVCMIADGVGMFGPPTVAHWFSLQCRPTPEIGTNDASSMILRNDGFTGPFVGQPGDVAWLPSDVLAFEIRVAESNIPEPATMVLTGLAGLGLLRCARRRSHV